jgi:hypothetical protein
MKILFILFLLAISPCSLSGTSEPLTKCQIESYCMDVKYQINSNEELSNNNLNKVSDNKLKITELDKKLAVFEYKYQALNDKIDKLDNTVWGNFSFTTELFMWVFVVGMGLTGLFIWRDHSVFRKRLEVEEKEIQNTKREIETERAQAKQIVINAKREINTSLENLKKRLVIDSAMISKSYNEDEIYVAIKHLSLSMDLDNYVLFKRLFEQGVLTEPVQLELKDIIKGYKENLTK